jgi:hypothetical protein
MFLLPPAAEAEALPDTTMMTTVYCCRRCATLLFTSAELLAHEPQKHEFSWKKRKHASTSKHTSVSATTSTTADTFATSSAAGLPGVHSDNINSNNNNCAGPDACALLFLEACPSWISEGEGKVHCPKCSARVGSFSWSGTQCSCGTWVTPAIAFQRARVDRKQRSQDAFQKMNTQLGALSLAGGGRNAGGHDGGEGGAPQDNTKATAAAAAEEAESVAGCSGEAGEAGQAEPSRECNGTEKGGDSPSNKLSSEALHSAISELTELGFEEPLVRVALQKNGYVVNAAMTWLFSPAAMDALDADGEVINK